MNRLAAALCLALAAGASHADNVCRLMTGGGLSFGHYDVVSSVATDSLMTLSVTCDRLGGPRFVTITMGIGPGTNSTSVNARRMAHGGGSGDYLYYNLFRDVSRSSTWGYSSGMDTVSQTLAVDNKDTASTTFTVYGRIPPNQDVTPGTYSDRVQISITP